MPPPMIKALFVGVWFMVVSFPGKGLLVRRSLVQTEHFPQQIRERPDQERSHVAHGSNPGVLERGETPFTVLANGDERLDRVSLRRGLALAAHHGGADRVHQGDAGAQEPHVLDLPYEARTLQPLVEELLVKRGDLLAPLEVGAVERDEISVLREDGGEGIAAAPVPAVHQLLIQGADGRLVGRVVRGGLVVHVYPPCGIGCSMVFPPMNAVTPIAEGVLWTAVWPGDESIQRRSHIDDDFAHLLSLLSLLSWHLQAGARAAARTLSRHSPSRTYATSRGAPGTRHSRRDRTCSSLRSGSSAAASVRQATKPSGRTSSAPSVPIPCAAAPSAPASSTPKRYTSSGMSSCFPTRSAAEIHAAPPLPASSTKRRPYRSMVEISRSPRVSGRCGARVPGWPVSSSGGNGEMYSDAPSTADERYWYPIATAP